MPPTVRSPIVMRKVLSATDGKRSTRRSASRTSSVASPNGTAADGTLVTSRSIFGVLPSNTSSGMSTGISLSNESTTRSCPSLVNVPITANGQRSRAQSFSKSAMRSAETMST